MPVLDKVTVETARASAVKHLAAEFLDGAGQPLAKWTARMKEPMRPVRAVRQHPGGFDVPEILRLGLAQSAVHVAGMGRDDGGVHLEAWVTMPVRQVPDRMAPDRDWTPVAQAMVEAVERVLRSLAQIEAGDATLPLLDVQTRCLYDSQVQPRGAVTLWGLRVTWPALAAAPQGSAGGPLAAANAWLTPALDGALRAELGPRPDDPEEAAAWERDVAGRVATTVPQRQWHALQGRLPSVTVEHGGGTIRQSGQELLRWVDDAGIARMQQVRGLREWPVTVRCWDSTEERSDGLLQEVLARIGRSWTWYHVTQRVKVARLLPPDHARGAVVTGAELTMLAVVPVGEAQRLPLLRGKGIAIDCGLAQRSPG